MLYFLTKFVIVHYFCDLFNLSFCKDEDKAFPMCLSFSNDLLYVGDSKSQLHLLNPAQGKFDIVEVL